MPRVLRRCEGPDDGPATGSWPARGKDPGAAALDAAGSGLPRFLFSIFFPSFNILRAPAMRSGLGTFLSRRPHRMGKGTSGWTMLCMTCGEGPSMAARLEILRHPWNQGHRPPPPSDVLLFFWAGKGHAVQGRTSCLSPSSYDFTCVCTHPHRADLGLLSCEARTRHREGRAVGGGLIAQPQPSVAPRPAPWDQVDCFWRRVTRVRGLWCRRSLGPLAVEAVTVEVVLFTCIVRVGEVVAAGINRSRPV